MDLIILCHIVPYFPGSLLAIGALFGSLSAVFLMDAVGRKAALLAFSVLSLFIGWTLLMAASQSWQLYVGRFLLGLGAGMEITISPVYIHETTKPDMRDICGSFPQVTQFIYEMHFNVLLPGDDSTGNRLLLRDGKNTCLELVEFSLLSLSDTFHYRPLLYPRKSTLAGLQRGGGFGIQIDDIDKVTNEKLFFAYKNYFYATCTSNFPSDQ